MGRPNRGYVLIEMCQEDTYDEEMRMHIQNKRGISPNGIVREVGLPDTTGEIDMKPGDRVLLPDTTSQKVEIDGSKFGVVHHLQVRYIFDEDEKVTKYAD